MTGRTGEGVAKTRGGETRVVVIRFVWGGERERERGRGSKRGKEGGIAVEYSAPQQ
jgi:hypothetical protein